MNKMIGKSRDNMRFEPRMSSLVEILQKAGHVHSHPDPVLPGHIRILRSHDWMLGSLLMLDSSTSEYGDSGRYKLKWRFY